MRAVFFAIALTAASAFAQVVPEREVEIIQSLYEAGKYAEAARRANESLAVANFTEPQRVKLHEIAGVSSFNLGDLKAAQAAFLQLLRINPDHILDPFAVAPPAIKVFDQVRRDHADALNLVRQQIALRIEQEKRDAAEKERLRKEQEERQKRDAAQLTELTVRTVERNSMVVNFIPFGAGQFQQGRLGWGTAFAIAQGICAVLSIVSYFAVEALYEEDEIVFTNVLTADGSGIKRVTIRSIPPDRAVERDVWTGLQFGTGIAFYALWALGVGDAVWHHEAETVTETKRPLPKPTARLRIFPTNGGVGAGVTIGF